MKVVEERRKIYGNFNDIAEVSQKIKDMYYMYNAQELDPVINEGIEMIIHKLARVICGGSRYIDNIRDIAGYAHLIINYLENQSEEAIDSVVMYKEKKNGQWGDLKNEKS